MRRFLFLLACALAACKVGPDYERPQYPVPGEMRGAGVPAAESFGDLEWFRVFDDPVLQELIRTALRENYDVRLAAERVMEARARVTIARSRIYPDVEGRAATDARRVTENGPTPVPAGIDRDQVTNILAIDFVWEIDFWGRFRRATEAARADVLASEMGRRIVVQSLVAELARAYFELIELDLELEIARRSLESRERSLRLVTLRMEQGVANKVEVRQAEVLVATSAKLIPETERRIEQTENLISLLVGGNPGPIPRGRPLVEQTNPVEVPAGLPSALLERRPDIAAAEQALVAANARIGEAKALLYPTIRLTASGGVASEDLGDLFDGGSFTWQVAPSLVMPIFNSGRLRANVEVTESQQRQAALSYLATVQQAFRETADALIGFRKLREFREYQEGLTRTLEDQQRLSNARYRGGVTSYLEVLDTDRQYLDAELALAQAVRNELISVLVLYRALGGGWQGAEEIAATGPQEDASGTAAEPAAES